MKSKSGPWVIRNHAEIFSIDGEGICVPYSINERDRANAKLISKAPDMAAILNKVLEVNKVAGNLPTGLIGDIETVLKKAGAL
jgi:hypothetical protein